MSTGNYKGLLKSFGFQSFLWTQFLGAFNDNAFKIVLSMIAVNMALDHRGGSAYVSLVGAIFILPFFLFSGYAGHFADGHNKRKVLIITKSFEIVAVTFGFFAFLSGRIELMLGTLFLMSLHSTFFGPAKYGILPEMLPDKDLSRANGLLEMSTFLAIILGTSAGTFLFSYWKGRLGLVGVFLMAVAVVGTAMSFGISKVRDPLPGKPFMVNPWSEINSGMKRLLRERFLLMTVAGITYFWFLGSLLQMDILLLGKEVMGLNDLWVGILITFLAMGIGAGSITAGFLSGDKVEPGLVPLGSIGMGVFSVLLAWSSSSYPRAAAALMMLGFSGGLFIVPLNALLQQKSGSEEKGRLIATNNFVNTGGILLASAVLWFLSGVLGMHADRIILMFGLLTIFSTVYLMAAIPDFFTRLILWMLTHTLYKIRVVGQENIPFRGPALLVCNHMSFVDGLLIGSCVQRFIRFMVYEFFCDLKLVGGFLRLMKAIPVADGNRREILASLERARKELKEGHIVCVFAEGAISRTGNLLPFKKGFEKIAEGLDVPVIPVHLDRVWGSVFSFKGGRFFWKWPRHFPYPVTVSFGKPMGSTASAREVRQAVMELASAAVEHRRTGEDLLELRFIKTARKRFFSFCMADSTGKSLTWGSALAGSLALSRKLKRIEGDTLGIILPSTVAGAISNAAALIAGKTPANLNFMAQDSLDSCVRKGGIKTILTSRGFISKAGLKEMEGMIYIEEIARGISAFDKAAAWLAALLLPNRAIEMLYCRGDKDPRRLATIMFTSGSTGEPKGVMLTHHNIISNIEGFAQVFSVTGKDVLMGVLPFFHAFGFTGSLWFPLVEGVSAVYHPNPLDAKTIGDMVRKHRATILIGTPSFYSGYVKKCSPGDFSSLRYAVAGAEKLRDNIAVDFKGKFGINLMEGYGCTELSPVVSVNVPDVEHRDQRQAGFKPGTVGHAIPGVSVKVVDPETGSELPAGKEGLLLVKGPNLMKGYLGDPQRTEETLRDGWYVTGDVASVGEDGFIKIVDRVSRFSKIAGEMVPHIKVEETVSRILGCDCAVTSVPDEARGEKLVAFYTNKEIRPVDVWEALLKAGLPRLWIPKRENFLYIESFPASATGKIDLKKLKGLAIDMFRDSGAPLPPLRQSSKG